MILLNKRAVSLVEVIVASLIFALATASAFTIIPSFKQSAQEKQRKADAALFGKESLENLRAEIDAQALANGTSALSSTSQWKLFETKTINEIEYSAYYKVNWDTPNGAAKVDLKVNWVD